MPKLKQNIPAIRAVVVGMVVVLALCVLWSSRANIVEQSSNVIIVHARTTQVFRDKITDFNERRCFALGMIETGNDDRKIGGAGEVSRYQLMPSVWHSYSQSSDYQNPQVSQKVAEQHWTYLHDYFKQQTGREPDDFDMYVLWNTRFGHYAGKGFKPAQLHPVVRERAQRFVNLVERGDA